MAASISARAGWPAERRFYTSMSLAIFAAVVVTGVIGTIIAARRPGGLIGVPIPPAQFAVVPLADMLLFATFVALAIVRRRDPQAHKRLILLGSIALIVAAVARWPGVIDNGSPVLMFVITDLYLLPLVAWDLRSRRRLHPVTVWGGAALDASQPLRLWRSEIEAWLGLLSQLL